MKTCNWLGCAVVASMVLANNMLGGPATGAGAGTGNGAAAAGAAKGAAEKSTSELLPGYTEIKFTALRARMADFNGKKVTFVAPMYRFDTEVGYLAEATGYKPGRDYRLYFNSSSIGSYGYYSDDVAVMAKKDKKTTDMLAVIDAGVLTRVYGKVRRFRSPPEYDTVVRYYVELDSIKVAEADAKPDVKGDDPPAPVAKPAAGGVAPPVGGPPVGGKK